jgi:hypothetical protein
MIGIHHYLQNTSNSQANKIHQISQEISMHTQQKQVLKIDKSQYHQK